MPGLNTIISYIGRENIDRDKLTGILKSMDYGPSYSHATVYDDHRVGVFSSGYDGYPGQLIEFDGKKLIIEGAIYNKTSEQIKDDLSKILPGIIADPGQAGALREFMFNTDGEYVIYYIDNDASTVVIFNDAMGRLPAYWYSDDSYFVLARVMKFLSGILPVQFDQNSLMEYFLFSAPLGEKTFFKNVRRMLPCSLFVINWRTGKCIEQQLHRYNFDDRWDDRPLADYAKNLHDLFLLGVSNRAAYFKDRKQIMAISGGLDSRANLLALLKLKIDFQAFTFLDFFHLLARDWPVVQTLEKMYNFKLRQFNLVEENIPDFERIVYAKDGTGLMGTMGSVLYSMEILQKEFGRNSVFYTGDEGNYITAPRYGGKRSESMPDLVNEIMAKNSLSVFSIDDVASLFGKTPKDVMDHLCEYFSTYPEKDNLHKVDHYFVWDRSFKFTMENQDRIRLYFWPLAPHYSIQYARYAFQIKNKYLAGWQIYRELLKALDPQAASVKYANFGLPLDSPFLPAYLKLRAVATANEAVRRRLRTVLRLIKKPSDIGLRTVELKFMEQFTKYLVDAVNQNPEIGTRMDTNALLKLIQSEKYLHKLYVSGNLVKYMAFVDGKKEMTGVLP